MGLQTESSVLQGLSKLPQQITYGKVGRGERATAKHAQMFPSRTWEQSESLVVHANTSHPPMLGTESHGMMAIVHEEREIGISLDTPLPLTMRCVVHHTSTNPTPILALIISLDTTNT